MAEKPKPAKKAKRMTAKEQSERFIQTARALGVDESGKEFNDALSKIVPAKNPHP